MANTVNQPRIFPDQATFERLAGNFDIVPVYRQVYADHLTPVSAFALLTANAEHAFLLESVVGGERIARHSFIAAGPSAVYSVTGNRATLTAEGTTKTWETGDPLADLAALLPAARFHRDAGLPAFTGGLVGYAGYDTVRYYEGAKLGRAPADDRQLPDLQFGLYGELVIFDHVDKTVRLVANAKVGNAGGAAAAYAEAVGRLALIVQKLSKPVGGQVTDIDPRGEVTVKATSNFTREGFEAAVARGQEYIRAGDIFQFVPSQRMRVESAVEPLDVYRALRVVNPSPFMFLLKSPACTLIGSSPEILCRVQDGVATSRPLAGTRKRGLTEEEDKALEADLLADPKERAEHIMLVDLHRNDIGRVAMPGSVHVTDVMSIERYSHVMHIVSNVTGRLRPDMTAWDALRVSLPVGTVSGAPKIRAMQIIDEVEPTRRGPYGGAVGYIDYCGNMDTCIALRTIVHQKGIYDVQAGCGVVADSVPRSEYEETVNKAKALLKAVELAARGL
jgi:anthranilate synthase component I